MRAIEVKIHNFRSIHDATIRLGPLSLIAGANNAGKSNVIDAIRLFYGDLKWDDDRDLPKVVSGDTEAWVEVEFQPTEDELAQLKDDYRSVDGTFRVRNYVRPSQGENGKDRVGYYAYEHDALSENLFYGAKNVGSGKVGHVVYIPAVSRIDDNTKLTGPSALRELVAEVLNKVVADSPAYQKLTEAFVAFEGSIKMQTSADGNSLESLEKEVTDEITSWDASFSLAVQSIQPGEIIKSLIKPQLIDKTHGREIDQARFGAGFQRHLIYTLIKISAEHANPAKKSSADKKEFTPQFSWILFEEPEAFLHPSREEVLHDSLLKLVKDGTTQVLLTTHSSRFVSRSMDNLTRLIRLRRDSGATTSHQLSQADLDKLFSDALVADDNIIRSDTGLKDSNQPALMASLKTEFWMEAARATAFFCQRVILVEGPSEVAIYRYLITRGHWEPPISGLAVIDCMGKRNIHRFVALLGAFGIDHSVLYDGDRGNSSDAEVTQSINGAKTGFTKKVIRLEHDLEAELGIAQIPREQ
ncbi:ATP-dependent nuclease [Rathayibacter toxicus]|uniref:ATP-dependent nuclease n=1 Tax=Rathayibacter toxicus TaxID=145458 RepID=UPI0015E3A784|nr:AAA family ATPase [Rathayibacter toxicus]QOD09944.1 AAA family ATPase [Rathayibacter toxicus]